MSGKKIFGEFLALTGMFGTFYAWAIIGHGWLN